MCVLGFGTKPRRGITSLGITSAIVVVSRSSGLAGSQTRELEPDVGSDFLGLLQARCRLVRVCS